MIVHKSIQYCLIFLTAFCVEGFSKSKSEKMKEIPPTPYRKMGTRPEKAFFNHTTNNMWSAITNYGSVGDPNSPSTGRPSAQWPGGSGNNYLYDGGIWIAGKIAGEAAVTTYFYNPDIEWLPTAGYPGEMGSFVNGSKSRSLEDSYMVYDDIEDRTESNHNQLGVKILQRAMTWSLPDFDDFIAFECSIVNTGLVGSLEDIFVSYWYDIDVSSSDDTGPHIDDLVDYDGWDGTDSFTDQLDAVDPFDLDGDGYTGYDEWGVPYAKDRPQNPNWTTNIADDNNGIGSESDGFWDEWAVIFDAGGDTLFWQADVEHLGRVAGEPAVVDGQLLKGYQFPRSLSYIYDGDNPGSSGNDYGEREKSPTNDGFLGGAIIYTPAPYNVVESGQAYMGAYSHQWWNWESDPDTDEAKREYIEGKHTASQGKKFLNNPLELGFPQFDYRFLLSTGPFDLAEGDTVKIVFVLVCGQGLQGLRENTDNAVRAYYSGSKSSNPLSPSNFDEDIHWNLPIPPEVPSLSYAPLNSGVRLAWDTGAEQSFDQNLGRIDFEGYQIYRATYLPQDWELIAAFDNLHEPVYVVSVDGDTLNKIDENGEWIFVDLPNIQNSYDDYGGTTLWDSTFVTPLNGLPYYYAVSAYDSYKSAQEAGQELLPSYSPLSNYKKSVGNAPVPVYPGKLYETGDAVESLKNVKVVPNPYRGTAEWEQQYEDRIKFTNLPPVAKISIFSLAGDLVKVLEHNDGTAEEYWDLLTRNHQSVVSGLYIYVVEASSISEVGESSDKVSKHIGKFAIFR